MGRARDRPLAALLCTLGSEVISRLSVSLFCDEKAGEVGVDGCLSSFLHIFFFSILLFPSPIFSPSICLAELGL